MRILILVVICLLMFVTESFGLTVTIVTTSKQDTAIAKVALDRGTTVNLLLKKGLKRHVRRLAREEVNKQPNLIINEWSYMSDADKDAIKVIMDNHIQNK